MTSFQANKKSLFLPWLLSGLGILALVVYFLISYTNREEKQLPKNHGTADLLLVRENNTTVTAFITFLSNDTNKMALDPSYVNHAILKLRQAIDAMTTATHYKMPANVNKAKDYANLPEKYSSDICKTAKIFAISLKNLQEAKYPELVFDANELQTRLTSINPGLPVVSQKAAIKSFFDKAADLLQKMN